MSEKQAPLGDPEIAVEILKLRVAELEQAIRRLAEQDATLSLLCKRDGSRVVTVTMDATLTDEERAAVATAIAECESMPVAKSRVAADTLRALLKRTTL
jgi:hypothetical protein